MNIKTYKLFLILAILSISIGKAQDQKKSTKLKIDLASTGNVQTGNFERLQFVNQLDFSIDSRDSKWNFHSKHLYLYQKVFGNKSQDDYLARNFLTYRLSKKLDVFGGFFYENLSLCVL